MNRRSSTWGLVPIGAVLPKAASKTLQRRGFAQTAVLTHWNEIVGKTISESSCPERLFFPKDEKCAGTLRIRVSGGLALELQHLEPLVIERINQFFGYRAVEKISIVQGPLPKRRLAKPKIVRNLSESETKKIEDLVSNTEDEELRDALRSLGKIILSEAQA